MEMNGYPEYSVDGSFVGAGGYGASSSENGSSSNSNSHGWQKVSYSRKKSGQDSRPLNQIRLGKGGGGGGGETGIFELLEKEAEERRSQREAKLAAAAAAAVRIGLDASENDSDGAEESGIEKNNDLAKGEAEKPKQKKPKKPKVTVVEAASAIDASELAAFLAGISESFPSAPDVQLMRCADYFGRAFKAVESAQFGWNKTLKESSLAKVIEIPLCYLSDLVKKTTSDWISTKPVEALGEFVLWALNDVLTDLQPQHVLHKGSKTNAQPASTKTKVAVLVVLGLVLRKKPDCLVQKASVLRSNPQYLSLEKLPMVAWAYGQAAQGDLAAGMYLWVQTLLPLAVGKASTPVSRDISLQFLESVIYRNKEKARQALLNTVSRRGERLVPPAALDSLMRAAFPSESARTKASERFAEVYPLVKEIALGGSLRSKATKPVAQQLLLLCLTAASEDIGALYHEACHIVVWCLSQNTDCYKQWEKLHLDNLKGSTRVLEYLCSEWQANVNNLTPLADLKQTVKAFRLKHEKAMEHGNSKNDHEFENLVKSADKHCKSLQKKMSRGITCKAIAFAVGCVGIALGFYALNPNLDPQGLAGMLITDR